MLDYPFSGISFGQVLYHIGVFVFRAFVFDLAIPHLHMGA